MGRAASSEAISAAIIAGGQSRRFGKPKASALFRGRPLIDHAVDLARQLSSDILINVNSPELANHLDFPLVADELSGCGPLGGVYSVLRRAAHPWVAVIPCDMPLLPADIYRCLADHRREEVPVAATAGGRIEPLVSLWPVAAAPGLFAALREQHFAAHRVLEETGFLPVSLEAALPGFQGGWLANINSPQDLENLS